MNFGFFYVMLKDLSLKYNPIKFHEFQLLK